MASPPPPRPAPLPITKTCIFKKVNNVPIHVDLYSPTMPIESGTDERAPIMLYIHGGGWMGSNRDDHSRPLFQHFLDLGFIIASMDYRLVPESSIFQQFEDVQDMEGWLKHELPREIGEIREEVQAEGVAEQQRKIIVAGASAGAHLCLFIPKLWTTLPDAMLVLYPPTNMHILPYSGKGRLASIALPPISQSLLVAATEYDAPPTQRAMAKVAMDLLGPRAVMATHVFRQAIIAEMMVKGLRNGVWTDEEEIEERDERDSGYDGDYDKKERQLRFPDKGCLTPEEVEEISPLHYLKSLVSDCPGVATNPLYPPTYILTGTNDDTFSFMHHSVPFHEELVRQNIPTKLDLQPGLGHAFDIWLEIGSTVSEEVLKPAAQWCKQWVR